MATIVVFDYGVGNLHSLAKALEARGAAVRIQSDPGGVLDGDALVLPGVGAFGAAAAGLDPAIPTIRAALAEGFPCLGICLGMQLLFEASDEGAGTGIGAIPGRVRRIEAERVPHMGWNAVEPVSVGDPLWIRNDLDARSSRARQSQEWPQSHQSPQMQEWRQPRQSPEQPKSSQPQQSQESRAGLLATGPERSLESQSERCARTERRVAYFAHSYIAEPADPADVIAWTEYDGKRFPAAVRRGSACGVQFHPEKSGMAGLQLLGNFLATVRP